MLSFPLQLPSTCMQQIYRPPPHVLLSPLELMLDLLENYISVLPDILFLA